MNKRVKYIGKRKLMSGVSGKVPVVTIANHFDKDYILSPGTTGFVLSCIHNGLVSIYIPEHHVTDALPEGYFSKEYEYQWIDCGKIWRLIKNTNTK